jgi:hypothetical protein
MEKQTLQDTISSEAQTTVVEPVFNERGVIAESYSDLQGLATLETARQEHPVTRATGQSTLRSVLQAAEVALLNLSDIMSRAKINLDDGELSKATVKLFWARAFHRLLTRISVIPQHIAAIGPGSPAETNLKVQDSPAFRQYVAHLMSFDEAMICLLRRAAISTDIAIGEASLDRWEFNLLHLARVCCQEATIWEHNLAGVRCAGVVPAYETFVSTARIREAVYERVLSGDTYFTQFRGLHQIPEIIGEEVNDRLEETIRALRADRLQVAFEHLQCIDSLMQVVVASVAPMADSLSTFDYHLIRENLGLTSGSHSVCLRFHMFTHLYEQLYEAFSECALKIRPNQENDSIKSFRAIAEEKYDLPDLWLLHSVGGFCLKFRAAISEWRDEHLNMPRNNLGGTSTKSLTGSPDAVKAVKSMRDAADAKDPFNTLAQARSLTVEPNTGELRQYFDSPDSLDSYILNVTGKITQARFVQVQDRLGFFATRCPFTPPPRRSA